MLPVAEGARELWPVCWYGLLFIDTSPVVDYPSCSLFTDFCIILSFSFTLNLLQEPVNDKLCLTESLLKLGAWKQAKELMDRLPQYHATSHTAVAKTMCQLVHYVIDPMYQR